MSGNKRQSNRQILPEPRVFINGKIEGFVEDLSIKGAGLVVNRDILPEVGSSISFTMDFGKGIFFRSIMIKQAKIVWSISKHYYDLNKIGVEFIEIDEEENQKLHDFLSFWEQDEEKIIHYVEELKKIVVNPETLSEKELQKILTQFSFLRVIPLSDKIQELIRNINVSKKLISTLEKIGEIGNEELRNLENTIHAFENAQDLTKSELQEKEEVIEAYEKLQDFMRKELLEKEEMLKATQRVLEIANQEKRERDKTIAALQAIEEMMRNEQIEKDKIIQAHEILQQTYRNEILEKEKLIEAFEQLQNLYHQEIQEKDKIVEMHTILESLAQRELLEKDKEIKIREELANLTRNEILEREKIIQAYDQFAEIVKDEIVLKDKMIERIEKARKDLPYEKK